MEPNCAVNLIAKNPVFKEAGIRVGVLVGDEDSSTIAAVQKETPHVVEKWVDTNHNTKNFNNKLYLAAKKYKFLNHGVIKYLKRCFSYCIAQNKNNVPNLKRAIQNISAHTFGEHGMCGEWCKAKSNSNYIFKALPGGKPFQCAAWRTDLDVLLASQVAKAAQIAPGASSQQNESFNSMCAAKASKRIHYANSYAHHVRVSCAVNTKNLGSSHVVHINKAAGLSPGGVTRKYREKQQELREKKSRVQNSRKFKGRRLFLKSLKSWKSAGLQKKEGYTYVSNMASTMERAVATAINRDWLPGNKSLDEMCRFVVVDTETTGFGLKAEIIQIAAKSGDKTFNMYMLPRQPIDPRATAVTGLHMVNGELYRHSERLETSLSEDVAQAFLAFLQSTSSQTMLLGHNIIRFDAPLIVKWLNQCGHNIVHQFCSNVYGFCDTVPLISQGDIKKQDLLARTYLTGPEWTPIINGAHCALTDCIILEGLLCHFQVEDVSFQNNAVTVQAFFRRQIINKRRKENLGQLLCMSSMGLSKFMLGKMAGHGITIDELFNEYKLNGKKGVAVCLGVQVNDKPRVTRNKRVLNNIVRFLEDKLSSEQLGVCPIIENSNIC